MSIGRWLVNNCAQLVAFVLTVLMISCVFVYMYGLRSVGIWNNLLAGWIRYDLEMIVLITGIYIAGSAIALRLSGKRLDQFVQNISLTKRGIAMFLYLFFVLVNVFTQKVAQKEFNLKPWAIPLIVVEISLVCVAIYPKTSRWSSNVIHGIHIRILVVVFISAILGTTVFYVTRKHSTVDTSFCGGRICEVGITFTEDGKDYLKSLNPPIKSDETTGHMFIVHETTDSFFLKVEPKEGNPRSTRVFKNLITGISYYRTPSDKRWRSVKKALGFLQPKASVQDNIGVKNN